ncbi:hypothetical protein J2Y48_005024 [Mycoplana sp. BE70]|uniref:hypothetical protein n=1 Tax=Mycoplana sp. BE70 TaxID=2817775 RepID=UPI0028547889|nr:hypothetical protein [Mycoplana sp. BE70]MDR6759706.1 hypothetical protein [Mycoplana sp. BE70]
MTVRTTNSEITFAHPFVLSNLVAPLQAGTYRLVVDEELIEGLSLAAYRRVATHLEIPAISVEAGTRQFLPVSAAEIASALRNDAELAMGWPTN